MAWAWPWSWSWSLLALALTLPTAFPAWSASESSFWYRATQSDADLDALLCERHLATWISPVNLPALTTPPPNPVIRSPRYTVLVNSFERPVSLEEFIRHHERCPHVAEIHVIHSENPVAPTPHTHPHLFSLFVEVVFHPTPTKSFNNRFRFPASTFPTDALIHMDDDIRLSCSDMDVMYEEVGTRRQYLYSSLILSFAVVLPLPTLLCPHFSAHQWRRDPSGMVSPFVRHHAYRWDDVGQQCVMTYETTGHAPISHGTRYSLCLTKTAMLHAGWNDIYTSRLPPSIHETVDRRRNCEDIAMAWLVHAANQMSAALDQPPPTCRAVHLPRVQDLGGKGGKFYDSGVSRLEGHLEELREIASKFSRPPWMFGNHSPSFLE